MPSVMRRINVISRCATLYKSEMLSGELNGCHHMFVFYISRNPGKSQEDIARYLCLNKSTVARSIAALEASGFVRRETDSEDKRVQRIYPTEKMLDILPRVKEISADWNKRITEDISEEELSVFNSVLEKIELGARRIVGAEEK